MISASRGIILDHMCCGTSGPPPPNLPCQPVGGPRQPIGGPLHESPEAGGGPGKGLERPPPPPPREPIFPQPKAGTTHRLASPGESTPLCRDVPNNRPVVTRAAWQNCGGSAGAFRRILPQDYARCRRHAAVEGIIWPGHGLASRAIGADQECIDAALPVHMARGPKAGYCLGTPPPSAR